MIESINHILIHVEDAKESTRPMSEVSQSLSQIKRVNQTPLMYRLSPFYFSILNNKWENLPHYF